MPRFLALVAAIAAPCCLAGCDLALAGPFMPPILPGVGFPLTGVVLDAETRLPIGGATVQSGLGSTITDGNGHFNLYGGLGSREVSVSRAGYTAVTDGDVDPNAGGDLQFELESVFSSEQGLPKRFLQLAGSTKAALPPGQPGLVTLAGQYSNVSNDLYQLDFGAAVPGKAFSSVLAWGTTNGAVNVPNQPFNFTSFYYTVGNWGTGETVPAGHRDYDLPAGLPAAEMTTTSVKYGNVSAFAAVQTEILLDFGVLGSVTVARQTASNQAIQVPRVNNLKYDIVGTATTTDGNGSSTVQLTTNDPAKATFQLLGVPKITSPANNATGAGSRPTFSWTPVPPDDVLYVVTLTEVGEGVKWVGRTRHSEIQYPGFSPGDINGGALRTDKKYTWTLEVIDALGATDLPTSRAKDSPLPVKPYRVRQRSALVKNYGFSP